MKNLLNNTIDSTISLLHKLDAETAHKISIKALQATDLLPIKPLYSNEKTACELFGISFKNPLGLAAGCDKNAEIFSPMAKIGIGFVEVGTVTPLPQEGNPPPRLFRLPKEQAVINRLGFNSHGMEKVAERIKKKINKKNINAPLGINIGANKNTENPIDDYITAMEYLMPLADYCTINVSSPNTPGLRELQKKQKLQELLEKLCGTRAKISKNQQKPLLVKISPDNDYDELVQIAQVIEQYPIEGVIIANTTVSRPNLAEHPHKNLSGGLSGKPLFELSTKKLAQFYTITAGKIPLIGVGGISSGQDAIKKIRAGASLLQIYTAFAYQGPAVIQKICDAIAQQITQNDNSLTKIIGVDAHKYQ